MGTCCSSSSVAVHPVEEYKPTAKEYDDSELVTIVYISRVVPGYFLDQPAIDSMVKFANVNNHAMGLSGYLLVAPPFFLQRLEGPSKQLFALVNGIRRDHRHTNFIVVEEKPIQETSYSNWCMRSFDLVKSPGTKFEAVSFILQSLSKGLTVSAKTIHPPFFDKMVAGHELVLQDEVHNMIVVTICLGSTVVSRTSEGKTVVDVPFLCSMVHDLHRYLCSLNPERRGLVHLYGGTVVQLAIRNSDQSYNLANKVVRACSELAQGEGEKIKGQIRISIDYGKVHVKHMYMGEDLRKGRYIYGETLTRSIQVAKTMMSGMHCVVVQQSVVQLLVDEFTLVSLGKGLHAVSPGTTTQLKECPVRPLQGPGRVVQSCESAMTALVSHREEPKMVKEQVLEVQEVYEGRQASTATAAEDETDLEWMYQLDNLSKAFEKSMQKKKRQRGRGAPNGRMAKRQHAKRTSVASSVSNSGQLLNIIYMSTLSDDCDMSSSEVIELGQKSAQSNSRLGLTGFLLFTRPYFLQYLEGPPAQVKDLFARIRTDERHCNVTMVTSRIIFDGTRSFGDWNMKASDLDAETGQEMAPLREVLQLLSRQFNQLRVWLPRLQHDILLSSVQLNPGAYAQCKLAAFAVLPKAEKSISAMINSLVNFFSRGGELLGFIGDHLVGYMFANHLETLLDEAADLCADFQVNVGIACDHVLLLNAGMEREDCDVSFYGPVFERAQELANQAKSLRVPIVAEHSCEVPISSLVWKRRGSVSVAKLDI